MRGVLRRLASGISLAGGVAALYGNRAAPGGDPLGWERTGFESARSFSTLGNPQFHRRAFSSSHYLEPIELYGSPRIRRKDRYTELRYC